MLFRSNDFEDAIQKLLWGYTQVRKEFDEKVFPNIRVVEEQYGLSISDKPNAQPEGTGHLQSPITNTSPPINSPTTSSDAILSPITRSLHTGASITAGAQLHEKEPERAHTSFPNFQTQQTEAGPSPTGCLSGILDTRPNPSRTPPLQGQDYRSANVSIASSQMISTGTHGDKLKGVGEEASYVRGCEAT